MESAKAMFGSGMPVHVSPLTLRKRFNPYATNLSGKVLSNEQRADRRQTTEFTSAWTLGSILSLGRAGLTSLTLFQTLGKQGVISEEGVAFPVYEVLKKIKRFDKQDLFHLKSSDPLKAEGFSFSQNSTRYSFLVNYTPYEQQILLNKEFIRIAPYGVLIKT